MIMKNDMLDSLRNILSGFTVRNEKFLFTTLARLLAVGCLIVAAYFVWKLAGQLNL